MRLVSCFLGSKKTQICSFFLLLFFLVFNFISISVLANTTNEHVVRIEVGHTNNDTTANENTTENKHSPTSYIENGRVFVPVRFVAEAFNMTADWGPKEGASEWITLENNGLKILLSINDKNINITNNDKQHLVVSDVAPQVKEGRTFLPIRTIGEILGINFNWGPKKGDTEWVEFYTTNSGTISGTIVATNVKNDDFNLRASTQVNKKDKEWVASENNNYLVNFNPISSCDLAYEKNALKEKGNIYYESTSNIIGITMSEKEAKKLLNNPAVKFIEPDYEVTSFEIDAFKTRANFSQKPSSQKVSWGLSRIFNNSSFPFSVWDIPSKSSMGVAIIDSGIDENHPNLPNISDGITTIDNTHWGYDGYGHGTHVAGIVAGLDNNIGNVGVAPGTEIYSIKVLDDNGKGSTSALIEGIDWAMTKDIPIINISLSMKSESVLLSNKCAEAYKNGHLLIVAAGNNGDEGDNTVLYPAALPSTVAVSSSDIRDQKACSSSSGSQIDLIAPGRFISSTTPFGNYETFSGTSMAAPHVSGAVALAWGKNPNLRHHQIKSLLGKTAEDINLAPNYQGQGLLRADLLTQEVAGVPIKNTHATLVAQDNSFKTPFFTNNKGEYLIEDIEPGVYDIVLMVDGYHNTTIENIKVTAGEITQFVDFHLYLK